jgi:hypothetical protein
MARNDKAITSVVAASTTDDYGTRYTNLAQSVGTGASGVFHQDQSGDAVFFDCSPIHLSRLLSIQVLSCHDDSLANVVCQLACFH